MKVIIPAYEPDDRLIKLIKDIKNDSDYDILVVNDGSSERYDNIFKEAASAGSIVLAHEENMGKGAALRTAFNYLHENGSGEGMVCADCDGQHAWKDIKRTAEELKSHPTSIILGCRQFVGAVPFKSRFGNSLTRFIYKIVTGNYITDTQTGLRGFSAQMLPWLLGLEGNRYEYEMYQLLKAKSAGYDLVCIPIETIYKNKNESSHFHPVKDSIRVYLPILKFCLASAACAIIDFTLLLIFKWLTDSLLYSVVAARVISSLCNYLLNKNVVFKSKEGKAHITLIKYYILAACILACNYFILRLFSVTLGLPLAVGKLLTEGLLYIVSFQVQHRLIFKTQS